MIAEAPGPSAPSQKTKRKARRHEGSALRSLGPSQPSDMQASCVKSNTDRVGSDCVTVLISAESRSFPKMYVASGLNKKTLGIDQLSLPDPSFSLPVTWGTPALSTLPVPGPRERPVGEGTLSVHPGLCAGPGLEAAAQLAQWAHVGTEVTCPPGRKAEAPPSASGFLVLIPEGRTPVTSAPLLACLPSSSHPCPWTLRDQDWPTCKIQY